MAEKLSESVWSSFAKKNKLDLDDGALLKALARFDKTDDSKPEPRLQSLKDVSEQIKKQVVALTRKKKELGDRPFNDAKDKLYALLEAAETLLKETQQALSAATADDDEDSPALLTTAMVPLVRQLHKGGVQMHALIASGGKRAAVLITRRSISMSRRKLLADYLQETGAIRYFSAECTGGGKALQFLLDSSPSGLSKKLRIALFEQTGLRTKVFVQFGEETETDGEDDEPGDDDAGDDTTPHDEAGAAPLAPPSLPGADALTATEALKRPAAPAQTEAEARGAGPDAGAAFKARLIELLPLIKQAVAGARPSAQDAKLRASEAGTFAAKKDFQRANELLDDVDALLRRGMAAPPAGSASAPFTAMTPAERAGPGGPISATVAFTQARLAWDRTRQKVQSDLRRLETAILAQCEAELDAADIAAGTKNLYTVLDSLDERLIDKLDEALNAGVSAQRQALHAEARAIVDEYIAFVASDRLMQDIDQNGFESTSILPAVNASLKLISTRLAAAQAG